MKKKAKNLNIILISLIVFVSCGSKFENRKVYSKKLEELERLMAVTSPAVPWSVNLNNAVVKIAVPNQSGTSVATGFLAKYKDKGYLITVKHVLSEYDFGNSIDLEVNNGTSVIRDKYKVYFDPRDNSSDVAVFPLPLNNIIDDFLELDTTVTSEIGAPIMFIGYPTTLVLGNSYGIKTVTSAGEMSPLVKRGHISGFDESNPVNKTIIFDAQSVSGFSGSPIFASVC